MDGGTDVDTYLEIKKFTDIDLNLNTIRDSDIGSDKHRVMDIEKNIDVEIESDIDIDTDTHTHSYTYVYMYLNNAKT